MPEMTQTLKLEAKDSKVAIMSMFKELRVSRFKGLKYNGNYLLYRK